MAQRTGHVRHVTAAADAFTGIEGEITIDVTAKELRVHDGGTVGGIAVARKDLVNVAAATVSVDGKMTTSQVTELTAATANVAGILAGTTNITYDNTGTDIASVIVSGALTELDADLTTEIGLRAAHVANVSNPHSVTAVQAGALAVASNLSDLAAAATARTNLGLGTAAIENASGVGSGVLLRVDGSGAALTGLDAFPTGTIMLFVQTNAPTGWTKLTNVNDHALRMVSGVASSGGATGFTSIFGAGKTAGSTSLSIAQMAVHTHGDGSLTAGSAGAHVHGLGFEVNEGVGAETIADLSVAATSNRIASDSDSGGAHTHTVTGTTASAGSGSSHNHTLSLDVAYTDVIRAAKD